MKYITGFILLFILTSCETKYNLIDTGLANGRHPCSMYEYFRFQPQAWDSTRLMIERGNLVDLFEGKRTGYEEITFFGPTNMSIRRWMIEQGYKKIHDIPVKLCEQLILRHVVKGKYKRTDIPRGTHGNGSQKGSGGTDLTGAIGNTFWIYTFRGDYEGIPDAGSVDIYILSLTGDKLRIDVASGDIEPDNGIVHSLSDYYQLGTL